MATKWYTLTVRVGVEEPINPPRGGIEDVGAPAVAMAPGIRDALGVKGAMLIDDIYLIPEDQRRGS